MYYFQFEFFLDIIEIQLFRFLSNKRPNKANLKYIITWKQIFLQDILYLYGSGSPCCRLFAAHISNTCQVNQLKNVKRDWSVLKRNCSYARSLVENVFFTLKESHAIKYPLRKFFANTGGQNNTTTITWNRYVLGCF